MRGALKAKTIDANRRFSRLTIDCLRQIRELGGPFVVLFLPLCFNPYADLPFEPVKVAFFRWSVGAMALIYILEQLLARCSPSKSDPHRRPMGARLNANPLLWPVTIYGGIYLLATAASINPPRSLWGWADRHGTVTVVSMLAFFFLLSVSLRARQQISRLIAALLLGTVPVSVYAIAQFLGMDPLDWVSDSISPVLSTMGRSNFLGAYLAIAVPFTLWRVLCETTATRAAHEGGAHTVGALSRLLLTLRSSWRLVVLTTFQIVCILLTQTRAAWLALTGGVLVFTAVLAHRRASRTGLWISVTISIIGASVLVMLSTIDLRFLAGPPVSDHTGGASYAELRADTVNSRIAIWRGTLALIPERWVLGYGPESFVTVFNSRYPPERLWGNPDMVVDDPHNIFLDHLVAAGALGLLGFLLVLGTFFFIAIRKLQKAEDDHYRALYAATLGAAVAFLIQAQFNTDIIVTSALFWVILAMTGVQEEKKGTPRNASGRKLAP